MMKKITFLLVTLLMLTLTGRAQYKQDFHKVEYMLKVDAGYLPFMTNYGEAGDNGYYNEDMRHAAGVNVVNGACISQDFFLGVGLGYQYMARPDNMKEGWHGALAFVDIDYRPLEEEWAPMMMGRVGANYTMSDGAYGNTLTPYAELAIGVNWYYNYVYSNMERNYKSLYVTLGVAIMQQTTFLPVRIGWRF